MPIVHTVAPGEHLPALAARYGFASHETIWNDPANAELKALGRRAEILFPGDQVTIPDKEPKAHDVATGQTHRFVLRTESLELRLRLRDLAGKPRSGAACVLEAEGRPKELTTDGDGGVRTPIARTTRRARLMLTGGGSTGGGSSEAPAGAVNDEGFRIEIGLLDPIEEIPGWQARLINLGYLEAPIRRVTPEDLTKAVGEGKEIRAAIEEFQCDMGLTVTGDMDEATRAELLSVHGC